MTSTSIPITEASNISKTTMFNGTDPLLFAEVSAGVTGGILGLHVLIWLIMRIFGFANSSFIQKLPRIPFISPIHNNMKFEEIEEDEVEEIEKQKTNQVFWKTDNKLCRRIFLCLFNIERPMSLDIFRHVGVIAFVITCCVDSRLPYKMTIVVSIFFVPFDIIKFILACFHTHLRRKNFVNERKRTGQLLMGFLYSAVAGFPLGTVAKVVIAMKYDQNPLSLVDDIRTGLQIVVYSVLVLLSIVFLPLFFVCQVYTCRCCCIIPLDCCFTKVTDLNGKGVHKHKCCKWSFGAKEKTRWWKVLFILLLISLVFAANVPMVWFYTDCLNVENILNEESYCFGGTVATGFSSLWSGAALFMTVMAIIAFKHDVVVLYLTDYVSSWCLIMTTILIAYHIEHYQTTEYWIQWGIPFVPQLVDMLFYYPFFLFQHANILQIVEEEQIKNSGKVKLVRLKNTGEHFKEVEQFMLKKWRKEKEKEKNRNLEETRDSVAQSKSAGAHIERGEQLVLNACRKEKGKNKKRENLEQSQNAIPQLKSDFEIKEILYFDPRLRLTYYVWNKYQNAVTKIKAKYKRGHLIALAKFPDIVIQESSTKTIKCDPIATNLNFDILDRDLNKEINEYHFFHGTSEDNAGNICLWGFDISKSGSKTGSVYGEAVYFAEDISKSNNYTDKSDQYRHMFLVRVCLGRPHIDVSKDILQFETLPCTQPSCKKKDGCMHQPKVDSICVDREGMLHREFLLFDDNQCFPEYLIKYHDKINPNPTLQETSGGITK